jgi:hypothetical protein
MCAQCAPVWQRDWLVSTSAHSKTFGPIAGPGSLATLLDAICELPWKPVVYLPANLTVRLDAEVLQAEDPGPWCERTAAALLGLGAKRKRVQRLASNLMRYAGTEAVVRGDAAPGLQWTRPRIWQPA